ncbi:MAG: Holliday junction resolvase RuvX [Alphaproteobacteria bacterium]|nr:Holliday junction resolvase RuvX [Alphaproteobacteria bacterium]
MDGDTINRFTKQLPRDGRLLGLDVGETTIGLALSDASRMIASPLFTIERKKFTADLAQLQKTIAEHAVSGLVIGYPVNMDGSLGPRTQSTRTFVSNLKKQIPLPMLLWDERMTTMAVERMMIEADMSRARRAELVDKLAASYILQGALDRMRPLHH